MRKKSIFQKEERGEITVVLQVYEEKVSLANPNLDECFV